MDCYSLKAPFWDIDDFSVHFCFFSTKTVVVDSCGEYPFGEYELFYPLEDVDKDDKDC